jgi:hypothetical protein
MAHYKRGKKALYEVLSKARLKPGFGRTLEKIREQSASAPPAVGAPEDETPVSAFAESTGAEEKIVAEPAGGGPDEAVPGAAVQTSAISVESWWRKPKLVQLNAGRIEFSMPYQLVVALILGLILLVLAAFRLGQFSYINKQKIVTNPPGKSPGNPPPKPQAQPPTSKTETPPVSKNTTPTTTTDTLAETAGKNVIVLVEYKARADLAPVQAHFAEFGIETEIVSQGGRYLLVTKNRYDNPDKPGTDGYAIKQKIIEVGPKYKGKAPEGYETFAPNFFKDAYGKKVE